MPIPRWLAAPIAALLVSVILAACGHEVPGVGASPSPSQSVLPSPSIATRPLVTVETTGGECLQGACGGVVAIERDGRVHATAPNPAELGVLSEVALDALATEIDKADFGEIKAHPFTETCPVAFDGQETIYTFSTAAGVERIASCEVVVDPENPLFIAVTAALAGVPGP